MVKSGYFGFLLFAGMMVIFFILPGQDGIQKPFRIGLGLTLATTWLALLIKKGISPKTIWPVAGAVVFLLVMFFRGTLQTAYINATLCLTGLLSMPVLFFELTPIRRRNLNYLLQLSILAILIQILLITSPDGRPSLGYEINLSGAYLFLFFLASDLLNNRHGKLLVVIISFFLLSRLLIFSLLIFYLIRFGKKYLSAPIEKLNAATMVVIGYIFLAGLSLWYTNYLNTRTENADGRSRILRLNDGSNRLRFEANTLVLKSIEKNPASPDVLLGYGSFDNFMAKNPGASRIPHNEFLDSVVQFGLLTLLLFAFISLPFFNKVTAFANLEYFVPLLFYTLILWVKYLLVPSFEMLFILFILYIAQLPTDCFVVPPRNDVKPKRHCEPAKQSVH